MMGEKQTILLFVLLSGLTEQISTLSTPTPVDASPCATVGMCCPGTNNSCSTTGLLMFSEDTGSCYCDEICIRNRDCCFDYNETCGESIDISFKSSESVVREGKSLWFQVKIKDLDDLRVNWFRNGILISNVSFRYIMTSSRKTNGTLVHTLNISSALQRDGGDWVVQASKGVKSASRSIRIQVIPRLLLTMVPEYDLTIPSSADIKLTCIVTNPISLFNLTDGYLTWQKDQKNNLSDYGFMISKTNLSTTLKKMSVKITDSGIYTCSYSSYPDPVKVSISIIVTNPEQIRCPDEKVDGIIWNTTISGTTKKQSCPENQKGTATRYCDMRGIWEEPNLINCTDVVLFNAFKELDDLIADGVMDTEKVQKTVDNTLLTVKNLTSQTSALSSGDITSCIAILEKIFNVAHLTRANIEKEAFFEVVDSVLSTNNSKSWTDVRGKTGKDGSSLLRNMDRFSEMVLKKDNITAANFTGENFKVMIDRAKVDQKGIIFPKPDELSNTTSKDTGEYATFLDLPKQRNRTIEGFTYVAVIYKTISEILPADSQREESSDEVKEEKERKEFVNSEILSLTTKTDLGILSPPLNLTFQHKHKNERGILQVVCVAWNFTINKWSKKGCKVNSTNTKRTVCQCSHLTNFAILMRPYTSAKEDKESLMTLSLVGVILSIAFTVLTLILFILTWKQIRSDQNIILLNLCGSLVLSYTVFIAAVEKTDNWALCIFITAVIHYLFLVTFFCMLAMGIYYFMSITVTFYAMYVANNFKSKSRVHFFLLGSWGFPLGITVITLGAFWGKNYHIRNYCWLSMESGSLYMFIVPVCVIAVINVIIMASLIRVLYSSSAMTKSSLQRKAASGLRSLGTLVPVLGVTWIFGVLAVNESAEIFQYIFIITNSIQGFCIFISHVLLNKKLLQGLRTKYPALSGLSIFTESSKKETSSVSKTQSSQLETPLVKPKKKGILSMFGKTSTKKNPMGFKIKKSDSFETEKTVSTDCSCSVSQQKTVEMIENVPKDDAIKMNLKDEKMGRTKPKARFNINLKKRSYTVTET